jgi:MraZ protein
LIFRGTFEHALDAKHRLTVPAKYRAALAGGVVLAFSPETEAGSARSLSIWPAEDYDAFASAALEGMHPLGPRAQFLRDALYANSFDLELDSANRLMIPSPAREFAGLDKEVVISGAGQSLQVWDRTAFAAHNASILSRFHEIAASFDHTN